MHSSISSSEISSVSDVQRSKVRLDRFTLALLGTALAIVGLAEIVTVARFDRTSKVQRREMAQRQALLNVKDAADTGDSHIAVLGNSLMLEGLDIPLLEERISRSRVPVPYFVLATNYYDWYFGLKRLFAEGMRPRYVVLGLSPNQLADAGVKGDYSARYLFQQSDLLEIVRKTHMDPTTASGFLLSHYSAYYSTRDVSRGFVLGRLLPGVLELLHKHLGTHRDPEIDPAVLESLSAERLAALDQLCRQYGSHFIFVVPPSYQKGSETIARAGRDRGITVLVPVANEEFDDSYFQDDGFHLNDKGAQVFTTRVAADLVMELSNGEHKQMTADHKVVKNSEGTHLENQSLRARSAEN
jgi:hypothetical protein